MVEEQDVVVRGEVLAGVLPPVDVSTPVEQACCSETVHTSRSPNRGGGVMYSYLEMAAATIIGVVLGLILATALIL